MYPRFGGAIGSVIHGRLDAIGIQQPVRTRLMTVGRHPQLHGELDFDHCPPARPPHSHKCRSPEQIDSSPPSASMTVRCLLDGRGFNRLALTALICRLFKDAGLLILWLLPFAVTSSLPTELHQTFRKTRRLLWCYWLGRRTVEPHAK